MAHLFGGFYPLHTLTFEGAAATSADAPEYDDEGNLTTRIVVAKGYLKPLKNLNEKARIGVDEATTVYRFDLDIPQDPLTLLAGDTAPFEVRGVAGSLRVLPMPDLRAEFAMEIIGERYFLEWRS